MVELKAYDKNEIVFQSQYHQNLFIFFIVALLNIYYFLLFRFWGSIY